MSRPRAASEQQLLAGEGDEYEESELHIKEAGVLPDEDSDLECKPADDGGGSGAEPGAYLYQAWPGNNFFCCGGGCMTGGDKECALLPNLSWPHLFVLGLGVALPLAIGIVSSNTAAQVYRQAPAGAGAAPGAPEDGSPEPAGILPADHSLNFAVVGVFWLTFLVSLCFLYGVAYTDPGILPRREIILQTGIQRGLQQLLGYDLLGVGEPTGRFEHDTIACVPDDLRAKGYRWCRTCQIIRPPRAAHCPDCDNCVLKFDHHCPFLNNCIGQRNYLFFAAYITSVLVLAVVSLVVTARTMHAWRKLEAALRDERVSPSRRPSRGDEAAAQGNPDGGLGALQVTEIEESEQGGRSVTTPAPAFFDFANYGGSDWAFLCVWIVIAVCLLGVLVLWSYHLFLMCTGKTTKEHLKGLSRVDIEEDVSCFGARGAKLVNPRAWIPYPTRLAARAGQNANPDALHGGAPYEPGSSEQEYVCGVSEDPSSTEDRSSTRSGYFHGGGEPYLQSSAPISAARARGLNGRTLMQDLVAVLDQKRPSLLADEVDDNDQVLVLNGERNIRSSRRGSSSSVTFSPEKNTRNHDLNLQDHDDVRARTYPPLPVSRSSQGELTSSPSTTMSRQTTRTNPNMVVVAAPMMAPAVGSSSSASSSARDSSTSRGGGAGGGRGPVDRGRVDRGGRGSSSSTSQHQRRLQRIDPLLEGVEQHVALPIEHTDMSAEFDEGRPAPKTEAHHEAPAGPGPGLSRSRRQSQSDAFRSREPGEANGTWAVQAAMQRPGYIDLELAEADPASDKSSGLSSSKRDPRL